MIMEPMLIAKPAPSTVLVYSICDITEEDMDNIMIGLLMMMDKLSAKSIQRMKVKALHDTMYMQREQRKKAAAGK
jgi:hypothetical protein